MPEWTDADVELVAAAIHRRDCTCGAWNDAAKDYARDILADLADAGRLLPAGAPVEWSVRFADGTVMGRTFTEDGAKATAAEYTTAIGAEPVWRRVGPWQPAGTGPETAPSATHSGEQTPPVPTPNPTQAQGDTVIHTMHNPQAGPPTVLKFRSKSGRTEVARRGDGTISIRVLTGQDRLDLDDAHKLAAVLAE